MAHNLTPFYPEAAPDVEVFLKIIGSEDCQMKVACINLSKMTTDLKQSLSTRLKIAVEHLQLWKNNVQLEDSVPLVNYDISPDDILEVRIISH